jgi:hypothetical protein
MRRAGIPFRRADNTRVSRRGAIGGWDQMRARILGDGTTPMLFVFETCHDFLRTIPVLQHDPLRPEDLDTQGEDHIADETRYACLARPLLGRPTDAPRNRDDAWRRAWGGDPLGQTLAASGLWSARDSI